ncbi:hypothetical protein O1611_g9541 [Lasiodiplodia mahajangana]|uniref:Uncharacterized protein n=1 Tax=Lasiodiplodia mahajangana TaxID=1108764 RepID=A0ACC2J825_9PEZI|nr:hypothetical protein O1611_g9541 [Lasiodiplodia mahajangana]
MNFPEWSGPRAVRLVRFRGRYHVARIQDRQHDRFGDYILRGIPPDPIKYKKWLKEMRDRYARYQDDEEKSSQICPDSLWHRTTDDTGGIYLVYSSAFPELRDYNPKWVYIVNLDSEVLTINYGVHWKLSNLPRQPDQWRNAIAESIYLPNKPTVSLEKCSEENIRAPAIEMPKPNPGIGYDHCFVTTKTHIAETQKAFLTYVLAKTIVQYKGEIIHFGREWSPEESLPFRELIFALISIASGQSAFQSFPTTFCHIGCRTRGSKSCGLVRLPPSPIWIPKGWIGNQVPLIEFGSVGRAQDRPPYVSPSETIYWFDNVLVSLVLVIDGEAITRAVAWGIEQGRSNFQIIVLTLFEITFAEVSLRNKKPFARVSKAVPLSPLRMKYCMSTHPRNRPEWREGMQKESIPGELCIEHFTGTRDGLQTEFPGLAALVNFFDAGAGRRATSKSPGVFSPELYAKILEFVDYDTWRVCLEVSTEIRAMCLKRYWLDDRRRLARGPFTRPRNSDGHPCLSFDFQDLHKGKVVLTRPAELPTCSVEFDWMPVIGREQNSVMLRVRLQFESAEDIPEKIEESDERKYKF